MVSIEIPDSPLFETVLKVLGDEWKGADSRIPQGSTAVPFKGEAR